MLYIWTKQRINALIQIKCFSFPRKKDGFHSRRRAPAKVERTRSVPGSGEQAGVRGELAAVEFQLQASVEIDS